MIRTGKQFQWWWYSELNWYVSNNSPSNILCTFAFSSVANPGTRVLIWEYSARAIKWIPTWQGYDDFHDFFCFFVHLIKVTSASKALSVPKKSMVRAGVVVHISVTLQEKIIHVAEQWVKLWRAESSSTDTQMQIHLLKVFAVLFLWLNVICLFLLCLRASIHSLPRLFWHASLL